ncbi:MAG TPA: hypothetical protein VHW70_12035 [Edaphobacter sp.]|jgi:hypothetical protein|nr:hypothetical protein [Edaphobacter sp.]
MRTLRIAVMGMVFVAACPVGVSDGQMFPPIGKPGQQPTQPQQIPGMPPKPGTGMPDDPMGPLDANRAERQAKLQNDDRQKRLVADTEKLLVLATDLKAQVDKSTKDTLSVDVIKKADEIEKLARSVKERMKG